MNSTKIFLEEASKYSEWQEALEIVKKNSKGNIWLIGSFIYRNLAHNLYGAEKPFVDFDFIIEKPVQNFILPLDWIIDQNSFGNIKLRRKMNAIDYVPLTNIHSITVRGLTPTIENYLTGTPLNVQSICCNINNQELMGDVGIKSIQDKLICINNLYEARYCSIKKGKSLNQYIKDIADKLSFTPVFPKL